MEIYNNQNNNPDFTPTENSAGNIDGKAVDADQNNKCTCGKNPGGTCGCKTGEGCKTTKGIKDCSNCSKMAKCLCACGTHKLEVYDWLCDLPEAEQSTQMVEVQFKNTRKGYYLNSNNLELFRGDVVAVESSPGHDIGEVTLTGKLVLLQMKKNNYRNTNPSGEVRRIYRIAKPSDLEKYEASKALEHKTMLRAREIAEELNLQMKISDVEYQGDGSKAIFYYIADERVDFRQLIKVYAEKFKVKIEMKQIGARQEAGRVGGIGPCGRELCCSSTVSSFVSVSTSAARYQDISLNPQKLAGQCGKLKCCLNYEVDVYLEAQRKLPQRDIILETKDSSYYHFKTDILSGQMTYSTDKNFAANLLTIDKDRVYDIIRQNKRGQRPLTLQADEGETQKQPAPSDVLNQDSITRFDSQRKKKKKPNRSGNNVVADGRPQGEEKQNADRPFRPQRENGVRENREAVGTNNGNNNSKKNFRRNNNKGFKNNNGKNNNDRTPDQQPQA